MYIVSILELVNTPVVKSHILFLLIISCPLHLLQSSPFVCGCLPQLSLTRLQTQDPPHRFPLPHTTLQRDAVIEHCTRQSGCLWFTYSQRYSFMSWFICSICPSICGWYAIDGLRFTLSNLYRILVNSDTNWLPQSLMTISCSLKSFQTHYQNNKVIWSGSVALCSGLMEKMWNFSWMWCSIVDVIGRYHIQWWVGRQFGTLVKKHPPCSFREHRCVDAHRWVLDGRWWHTCNSAHHQSCPHNTQYTWQKSSYAQLASVTQITEQTHQCCKTCFTGSILNSWLIQLLSPGLCSLYPLSCRNTNSIVMCGILMV